MRDLCSPNPNAMIDLESAPMIVETTFAPGERSPRVCAEWNPSGPRAGRVRSARGRAIRDDPAGMRFRP